MKCLYIKFITFNKNNIYHNEKTKSIASTCNNRYNCK